MFFDNIKKNTKWATTTKNNKVTKFTINKDLV